MAKSLFEETKAFLKLVPQFELTNAAEAQLTTAARISGPRGQRAMADHRVDRARGIGGARPVIELGHAAEGQALLIVVVR